jgi:hypothetical protein
MNFLSLIPLLILIAKDQDPVTTLGDINILAGLVNDIRAKDVSALDTLTVAQLRTDAQALAREAELVVKLLENDANASTALSLVKQFLGGVS